MYRMIEPGVHKLLANYQTGSYKFMFMSIWKGTAASRSAFKFITHPLNPLKHED